MYQYIYIYTYIMQCININACTYLYVHICILCFYIIYISYVYVCIYIYIYISCVYVYIYMAPNIRGLDIFRIKWARFATTLRIVGRELWRRLSDPRANEVLIFRIWSSWSFIDVWLVVSNMLKKMLQSIFNFKQYIVILTYWVIQL